MALLVLLKRLKNVLKCERAALLPWLSVGVGGRCKHDADEMSEEEEPEEVRERNHLKKLGFVRVKLLW
jgi:hypothetical protein